MTVRPGALAGVRVIDFTTAMFGPTATQFLGDFGADIIKIERPEGDYMRSTLPDPAGLDGPLFLSVNRNKRSITLDLKNKEAMEIVADLVRGADVVVGNYRAGVMERLGLGYDALKELNPRIIWASGTSFGTSGPLAHKAGIDQLGQGVSGLMARRPTDDTPPSIYPTMLCDYTAAMHLTIGILVALAERERSGEGQKVEASLLDSAFNLQIMEATEWLTRGTERNFSRMPLNGVYETSDGHVLMMGVFIDNALRRISQALQLGEDLSLRPEFSTQELVFQNREELQSIFRERLRSNTTDYWLERLEELGLMSSRMLSMQEALVSEQAVVNEVVVRVEHPNPALGTYGTLASPVHLSATPATVARPAPQLGQHSDEILRELGYDDERIVSFRAKGVVP